jgi:NAD(P)-dependent dehydrogenase (short-subunit alcohol dehydrogenase family)
LAAVARDTGAAVCVGDMSDPADVAAAVSVATDRFGRLDGVVANAGIMRTGTVLSVSLADWDESMAVNLRAPLLLARAALPALIDAHGSFVAISSIAALRVPGECAPYAVAKAGLTMLTQTVAVDFAAQGVRANVVCPGWVRTEMADAEMAEFGDLSGLTAEQAYGEVTRLVPQRRPAQAGEIADVVHWLLGPESSYVTGVVLTVDGGTTLIDPGTVGFDYRVEPRR